MKVINENPRIPLLNEVVAFCVGNRLFMNVEIKPSNPVVADLVLELLKIHGHTNENQIAAISSFQRPVVQRAIELGGIGVGALYNPGRPGGKREPTPSDFYDWIVRARKAQNQALHAHDTVNLCIETAQRPQLEAAQSAGVGTLLWFPMGSDTVENVQKAVSLLDGVGPKDKVICGNDLPQLASAILHAGL